MMKPEIVERPDVSSGDTRNDEGWIVTVFNNDENSWAEVMQVLIEATNCTQDEATIETWEIHNLGKSVVHHAAKSECDTAAAIIKTIGIKVSVSKE